MYRIVSVIVSVSSLRLYVSTSSRLRVSTPLRIHFFTSLRPHVFASLRLRVSTPLRLHVSTSLRLHFTSLRLYAFASSRLYVSTSKQRVPRLFGPSSGGMGRAGQGWAGPNSKFKVWGIRRQRPPGLLRRWGTPALPAGQSRILTRPLEGPHKTPRGPLTGL